MMSRLPDENKKKVIIFFSYSPLQILALKTCSQDISKTITASSLKLCQLIEYNEWITWSFFKKKKKVILLFLVIVFCKFGPWKFVIKISQKLL